MRMRKKPNLIPRMERCARVQITDSEERRGRWGELMPEAKALHLELGCGKGRFTAEMAAGMPETLFVAVERVPDAMVIAMERVCALELHNVFFVDADAAQLPAFFAPGEVDRIYINFCDPWPGNRHAKRRLTHPNFLRLYRQVLKEGGDIHFKTDNRDLFEWSLLQFPQAGFSLEQVTRDLHAGGICGVMTDYEEKFHLLGTPINRCEAVMGPESVSDPAAGE
ncbi:tRNA (guanosine(46)-N7)-methyltransferase TrmB [uncultured Flavonifractor sp.]|uniref:tRNA (guanosine(46)-N7)-methyltransferase TrmB n=1 Tax=uncultured Flavonifractor sp. TaxID=1193534 RepID=UPI00261F6F5A|nr:tRNA (guanosine(46)-N7)-methyltransferase TrmB [uncultured Flavonifractor sp.]